MKLLTDELRESGGIVINRRGIVRRRHERLAARRGKRILADQAHAVGVKRPWRRTDEHTRQEDGANLFLHNPDQAFPTDALVVTRG